MSMQEAKERKTSAALATVIGVFVKDKTINYASVNAPLLVRFTRPHINVKIKCFNST